MKIALVTPKNNTSKEGSFYDYKFIADFVCSKKYFSYLLAIPVLLSLTPEEHQVRVFDENIETIDFDWDADLVGISTRTIFAVRAYEIADEFRKLGHGDIPFVGSIVHFPVNVFLDFVHRILLPLLLKAPAIYRLTL